MAQRVAHLGCRQDSGVRSVAQRDVYVWHLDSSLFVNSGENDDPHRKGNRHVARGPPSLFGERRTSSVEPRSCSALGCNTLLNVDVFSDEQSSVRVWPRDFNKETIGCVRNRSVSTKFWGDTLTDTELEQQRETIPAGGPQSLQGGMA